MLLYKYRCFVYVYVLWVLFYLNLTGTCFKKLLELCIVFYKSVLVYKQIKYLKININIKI